MFLIYLRRPCALVSGSFSVPLSSSLLVELGYVSRVYTKRKARKYNLFFYLKNHSACASGVTPTTVF